MKRLNRDDWFGAGFALLEAAGYGKITVDNLCGALQVTKGSFYHHFENIDGYIAAFMEHWLERNTQALIHETSLPDDPLQRLSTLRGLVFERPLKREKEIRGWGFAHGTVRDYVERVDRMRLEHTQALMRGAGLGEKEAETEALHEYACLIGVQQLRPDLSATEMEALYARLRQNSVYASRIAGTNHKIEE